MVIVVQCGGRFADFLRVNGYLKTTAVRKIFNTIGMYGSHSMFLIVIVTVILFDDWFDVLLDT